MKIKKKIPLIDQHDKNGFWGGKFGGSFIPETLKKPIEDLTKEFQKLRNDKNFIKKKDFYFENYIGSPTSFVKLENLSNHLGGAQIWAKIVSEANGGAHKIYNATVHALIENIQSDKELMLAGNIQINDDLENYKKIEDIIDISGGLETSGLKDINKIETFLNKLNDLNNEA